MQESTGPSRSFRLSRPVLLGMEEVLGRAGVQDILEQAGLPLPAAAYLEPEGQAPLSYRHLGAIQKALEARHGPRSGRGLALCAGRSSFNYGLRDFGGALGLLRPDFRLLPSTARIPAGLRRLAGFLSEAGDLEIHLEETPGHYTWVIERCPICSERRAGEGACLLLAGFVQEYLYWASGGRFYQVVQSECAPSGAPACRIAADKQALD